MRSTWKAGLVAVAVGTLLTAPLSAASATETDDEVLDVVGLLGGTTLVMFSTDDTSIKDTYDIDGLDGDDFLVGIDYRVQDGKLYGVGNNGGVYTIDNYATVSKVVQLTVGLEGDFFGVDFNPAANALRITSNTGQNLRQPFAMPNTPTVEDGDLTNPATPPATGTVPATGVAGSAYANNDLDPATSVTLFALDTDNDRISIQSPANAGTLAATGSLGVDAGPDAGFDIYSELKDGVTVDLQAFATIEVDDVEALYTVNLLSGSVSKLGDIDDVTDIAIPLDQ